METKQRSKGLHIGLWIVQVLLGLMFLMAGIMKTFMPVEQLAKNLPWVADASVGLVRFIGVSELLGGLGLILPSLLRIFPKLSSLAALGIAVIMVLGAIQHIQLGETNVIGVNIVIFALAVFVAWGRFKLAPIPAK